MSAGRVAIMFGLRSVLAPVRVNCDRRVSCFVPFVCVVFMGDVWEPPLVAESVVFEGFALWLPCMDSCVMAAG